MDPDKTLDHIRNLVWSMLHNDDIIEVDPEAAQLGVLVDSLDTWMTKGGSLPAAWARAEP